MQLARVTGTVTATAKDPQFVGLALLICECTDAGGKGTGSAIVAADTVGAGVGDRVLISTGSAARMLAGTSGTPVDAAISAIVDQINMTSNS